MKKNKTIGLFFEKEHFLNALRFLTRFFLIRIADSPPKQFKIINHTARSRF